MKRHLVCLLLAAACLPMLRTAVLAGTLTDDFTGTPPIGAVYSGLSPVPFPPENKTVYKMNSPSATILYTIPGARKMTITICSYEPQISEDFLKAEYAVYQNGRYDPAAFSVSADRILAGFVTLYKYTAQTEFADDCNYIRITLNSENMSLYVSHAEIEYTPQTPPQTDSSSYDSEPPKQTDSSERPSQSTYNAQDGLSYYADDNIVADFSADRISISDFDDSVRSGSQIYSPDVYLTIPEISVYSEKSASSKGKSSSSGSTSSSSKVSSSKASSSKASSKASSQPKVKSGSSPGRSGNSRTPSSSKGKVIAITKDDDENERTERLVLTYSISVTVGFFVYAYTKQYIVKFLGYIKKVMFKGK